MIDKYKRILLVCTGNTCRSSMAEGILRRMIDNTVGESHEYEISSAGLSAFDGSPATSEAVKVMNEIGIDISKHRARSLTRELVEESDLILVMTLKHKEIILDRFPKVRGKVYTLKELANIDLSMDEIGDELSKLYERMESKKTVFSDKFGRRLEELNKKRDRLRRELCETESEIDSIYSEFDALIEDEQESICQLEEKLHQLDIVDPFGGDLNAYRRTLNEISSSLERLVKTLGIPLFDEKKADKPE